MSLSPVIYKRDSNGGLRTWQYEVNGNQYRTIAGGPGRKPVTSGWSTCKGKQGRTDDEQAAFEANASMEQKLKREYRLNAVDAQTVPISPMLAKTYEGVDFPVYCQPKLDGIRALITKDGAFTREYQRHLNVDHILQALAPVFGADPDMMLDGELYNHDFKDNFGQISSIVRKQSPTPAQRAEAERYLQFHCYDFYNPRHPNSPFSVRIKELIEFVMPSLPEDIKSVVLVPTMRVTSQGDLDEAYGQFLEVGYEGQMVRLDAPYEPDKRSKHLLKRKEFITAEFKLLRIEEGNGNWAGLAKRVVFQLPDGRECGAGIRGTAEGAKDLLLHKIMGGTSTVTIRHFTPTPDGMPRFPVAIDFHFGGRRD